VQQPFQWSRNLSIIMDETPVAFFMSQCCANFLNWSGGNHIQDGGNLSWVHEKVVFAHDMAQQYTKGCTKYEFLQIQRDLKLVASIQH
jgi:hypothetical protein